MAKKKKQKLPKDFETLLKTHSVAELQTLFTTYDLNARGGYGDYPALAFSECPDELARWLVDQGADLHAENQYGETPLHARARHWRGQTEILLQLGADPNRGEGGRGTPLHEAADSFKPANVQQLLAHGAWVDALNREGQSPLARALQQCRPADITNMTRVAEILLTTGAQRAPDMKVQVARIGAEFEFVRSRFNPDSVNETSASLERLYRLFDVPAAPRRQMHDGKGPIAIPEGRWEDQHQALWELLVPGTGAAQTIQGEVIRISGRIQNEWYGNGGVNWDADYRKMAQSFLDHIATGNALSPSIQGDAKACIAKLKRNGDASLLCNAAVSWVALNPIPIALPPPPYRR